jgi:hypothetical protein
MRDDKPYVSVPEIAHIIVFGTTSLAAAKARENAKRWQAAVTGEDYADAQELNFEPIRKCLIVCKEIKPRWKFWRSPKRRGWSMPYGRYEAVYYEGKDRWPISWCGPLMKAARHCIDEFEKEIGDVAELELYDNPPSLNQA